jgi:hypothetical protein
VSPLLRAQEQEEVVRNDKFAELIVARFGPQVAMVVIDIIAYAKEQGKKLGIDPNLIRDEAKMKAAIEQLMPVLKATGVYSERDAAGRCAGRGARRMTDKPPRASWQALDRSQQPDAAAPTTDDTPEEMVMRAVLIGPGAEMLAWLRKEYIEKRNRAGASEADLRELEAQRALVHRLESMRDKGVAMKTERNKKP